MRIAIDTGGPFTDCVHVRGARLEILKVFSTPAHPARAIPQTIRGTSVSPVSLLRGAPVGTNALLERRGARIALVTTAGFEDVLVIGRQARPRLYDFFVTRPEPLVHAAGRPGIPGG